MSEHFGSLALPVGEFLALEHGTEYHGCCINPLPTLILGTKDLRPLVCANLRDLISSWMGISDVCPSVLCTVVMWSCQRVSVSTRVKVRVRFPRCGSRGGRLEC